IKVLLYVVFSAHYMTDGILRETLKDVDDDNYLVIVVDEAHVIFELNNKLLGLYIHGVTLVYDITAIFLEIAFLQGNSRISPI
ncbi:hypothetical protein Tco_1395925, partial [Tanacetum coccineum]